MISVYLLLDCQAVISGIYYRTLQGLHLSISIIAKGSVFFYLGQGTVPRPSVSGLGRPLWLRVIQSASCPRNLAFPVCYRRTSSGRININRLTYKCIGTQDLAPVPMTLG